MPPVHSFTGETHVVTMGRGVRGELLHNCTDFPKPHFPKRVAISGLLEIPRAAVPWR